MSLIVSLYLSNGIVMSADSFSTNKNGYVSPNSNKLFVTESGVGISTCGNRTSGSHHIEKYMEEFLSAHPTHSVTEVANDILGFFLERWEKIDATFLVAGYEQNSDGSKVQKKYRVSTENKTVEECTYKTGAQWNGNYAILNRLITQSYYKDGDSYCEYEHYKLNWAGMNLQDGIDFCRFITETTSRMMSFQNRQTTVGGNVDILVIKPDGYVWVSRKELR